MPWGDDDEVIGAPLRVIPSPGSEAGQWGDDDEVVGAPVAKRGKSHALGFYKGVTTPVLNASQWVEGGLKKVGVPVDAISEALGDEPGGVAAARQRQQQHIAESPQEPSILGQMAGSAVAGLPLAAITRNPAVLGGMTGALETEKPDDLGQVVMDTALGAAAGHYGDKLVRGAGNLLAPAIDPAARMLHRAGVRLTPGQALGEGAKEAEDLAMSMPVISRNIIRDRNRGLADFDRGAANRALMPVGIQLPANIRAGHDAVAFLEDQATQRYQRILPRLRLQADQRLMSGVQRAHQIISGTDPATIDQFNNLMRKNMLFNAQGQSHGRPLVQMIRDTREAAYNFLKSDNANERTLGEALASVEQGIRGALRHQNPALARDLRATDRLYRGVRIVSDASSRAIGGLSSAGQMRDAVRRADPTKNRRASGMGRAYMQDFAEAGGRILPSQVRDSGTATRIHAAQPFKAAKGAVMNAKYGAQKLAMPFMMREQRAFGPAAAQLRQNPNIQTIVRAADAAGQSIGEFMRRHPGIRAAITAPASAGGFLAGL